jgi:hypothetical protein
VNGAVVRRGGGRLIAGVILVGLGLIYALQSFGLLYAGDLLRFWPLILVGVGVTKIIHARFPAQRTAGFVVAAVGVLILLWTLNVSWFRARDVWPVVLLLVGGSLIWQAMSRAGRSGGFSGPGGSNPAERILGHAREDLAPFRREHPGGPEAAASAGVPSAPGPGPEPNAGRYLNEFAIMGGGDRIVRSQDFRGGEVTAIMGGFGIDLRGAAISGDSATIHVFALWGGVEFKVPEEWNVVMAGVPILGAFTNSAASFRPGEASARTLIVKGTVIMGGVEVKN